MERTGLASFALALALAAAAGGTLLWLGSPRALGAFVRVPGSPVLERFQSAYTVTLPELARFADVQRRALLHAPEASGFGDLGLVELKLALADKTLTPEAVEASLERAAESLARSVSMGPVNPYAWTRLALAEYLLRGPSERAAGYLTQAILTGRVDPALALVRLDTGLVLWEHFAAADRSLVQEQARLAWARAPSQVAAIAARTGRRAEVREALERVPGARREFDRLLRGT